MENVEIIKNKPKIIRNISTNRGTYDQKKNGVNVHELDFHRKNSIFFGLWLPWFLHGLHGDGSDVFFSGFFFTYSWNTGSGKAKKMIEEIRVRAQQQYKKK